MLTTANAGVLLVDADAHALITEPVMAGSIAAQVATTNTGMTGSAYRVPLVKEDPTAAWVNEGDELPVSDAAFGEVEAPYRKVAGLSIVTAELAADSNPAATEQIGVGLARDIIKKVDAAFFGNLPSPAPSGLESIAGNVSTILAGASITNADPFLEGLAAAEAEGTTVGAWVANPTDALALAKLKRASGSNEPLLGTSAAEGVSRTIGGVQLLTSPAVKAGTIWGIPQDAAHLAIRQDVTVESDRSVYFTSDRVAVRARMRVALAFPNPLAIARIVVGDTAPTA